MHPYKLCNSPLHPLLTSVSYCNSVPAGPQEPPGDPSSTSSREPFTLSPRTANAAYHPRTMCPPDRASRCAHVFFKFNSDQEGLSQVGRASQRCGQLLPHCSVGAAEQLIQEAALPRNSRGRRSASHLSFIRQEASTLSRYTPLRSHVFQQYNRSLLGPIELATCLHCRNCVRGLRVRRSGHDVVVSEAQN